MRNRGAAIAVIARLSQTKAPLPIGSGAGLRAMGLLVLLGLAHDLLSGEVDAAGREGVADEEVVGLIGVVVLAVLEVGVLDLGQRQLDRLRDYLAFQRRDSGLDGDRDLGWAGTCGRTLQALA